jgi:hypothetical protein
MVTKKDLVENVLMREIITIRVDTLWKMLSLKVKGQLPKVEDEGATGAFDNKGAIFIPGGLIYSDVDENPINYESHNKNETNEFRRKIRSAMHYDNATLLYPDGMVTAINLDSGFFSKAARKIFTYKKAALKRKKGVKSGAAFKLSSGDITHSHSPTYIKEPYGARARLSSCLSVGLIEPPIFYVYCMTEFGLSKDQEEIFTKRFDNAQRPVMGKDGSILSPPYIVVCHSTRYREEILTGITRILGIGKFGEFATFTLEEVTRSLLQETKLKKEEFSSTEIFAEFEGIKVAGVLRIYAPTTPGKRSSKTITRLISPSIDLGLDTQKIEEEARKRYKIQ